MRNKSCIARHHHIDHQEQDRLRHGRLVHERVVGEPRRDDPWGDDSEGQDCTPRDEPLLPSGRHFDRSVPFDMTAAHIGFHPCAEVPEIGETDDGRVFAAIADRVNRIGDEVRLSASQALYSPVASGSTSWTMMLLLRIRGDRVDRASSRWRRPSRDSHAKHCGMHSGDTIAGAHEVTPIAITRELNRSADRPPRKSGTSPAGRLTTSVSSNLDRYRSRRAWSCLARIPIGPGLQALRRPTAKKYSSISLDAACLMAQNPPPSLLRTRKSKSF
jgi:hypothetical protein